MASYVHTVFELKKLNQIVLVDDEESSNFLNQVIIRQSKLVESVVAFEESRAALDKLKESILEGTAPELVLLDINMPQMNGWEFVDEFSKLVNGNSPTKIVMLTSSINPKDQERAESLSYVSEFRSKPLTTEMLSEIIKNHFDR